LFIRIDDVVTIRSQHIVALEIKGKDDHWQVTFAMVNGNAYRAATVYASRAAAQDSMVSYVRAIKADEAANPIAQS
jgi:hypothetical protein